jgi:hypothetical protein
MAAYVTGVPAQIPADSTPPNSTTYDAVANNTTTTHTLKKVTPKGTDGSITIVNGRITAYTAPT